jgi:methylglyoxal synthase
MLKALNADQEIIAYVVDKSVANIIFLENLLDSIPARCDTVGIKM